MIDTIKTLLRGIGRAGSYLVPYRSGGRLSTLGDYLYTAWLARHFKHIGANVYIRRPVSLKGGKYISIGSHSVIQKGCILNAWDRYGDQSFTPEIAIGEHVSIGEWSHLSANPGDPHRKLRAHGPSGYDRRQLARPRYFRGAGNAPGGPAPLFERCRNDRKQRVDCR